MEAGSNPAGAAVLTAHGRHAGRTLAVAALGVVYGDIGTSPLYAIKEVFGSEHHPVPIEPANVLGILSLVVWALIVVVSIKYVAIVLRADNNGEGGIMALMARVLSQTGLGPRSRAALSSCSASSGRRSSTATAPLRRPSRCCPPSKG